MSAAGLPFPKLDDASKAEIRTQVQDKLKEMSADTDILPEYVMVMVGNQKNKAKVAEELKVFLHDASDGFADWLWDKITQYLAARGALPKQPDTPAKSSGSVFLNPPPPVDSTTTISVAQPADIQLQQQPAVQSQLVDPSREYQESRLSSVVTDYSQARESAAAQEQVVERRHSVLPHDPSTPRRNPRQRLIAKKRIQREENTLEDTEDRPIVSHSSGIRLLAAAVQQSVESVGAPTEVPAVENEFDRTVGYKRKREEQIPVEGDVKFTITMEEPETLIPDLLNEEAIAPPPKKATPVKCQFWPNCKKPNCSFHHPTETCKLFPHCPYGTKCFYIHPSTPCNFGSNCTRPNCQFTHPTAVNIVPVPTPIISSPYMQSPTSTVKCAYGLSCHKPGCKYLHPNQASFPQIPLSPMAMPSMPMSFPVSSPPSAPPCRNGYACSGRSTGTCSFFHPPEPCKFGSKCTRQPNCNFAHGKICHHGVACTTPGCTFVHTSAPSSISTTFETGSSDANGTSDVQTPTMPLCKHYPNCTKLNCKYYHPTGYGGKKSLTPAENADVERVVDSISATLPPTPPRS